MHQPEKVELTNTQVTYRIDSSGEHDPLLFLSSESSSLLRPQLHLMCNTTPLCSRNATSPANTWPFLPALFSSLPFFHTLCFFYIFLPPRSECLFSSSTLEMITVGWKLYCLQTVNKRGRTGVCLAWWRCSFFIIIPLVLEVLLSPRGWRIQRSM